jgi:RNA polymerase sigma-70 factor (ECF subfamily)
VTKVDELDTTATIDAETPERDHNWRSSLQEHLPSLRRYALKLTRRMSQGHADDLVNDAVVKALQAGDRHPPQKGRVRSWLMSIVHNSFINTVRREQTAKRTTADLAIMTNELGRGQQQEQMASIELKRVSEALKCLPDSQRRVLLLVCVDGLSYQEVADLLGIPIGTVMSTLARARKALRDRTMTERGAYGGARSRQVA